MKEKFSFFTPKSIITAFVVIFCIITCVFVCKKNVKYDSSNLDAETLMAMKYARVNDNDKYVANTDGNVIFEAFFTRDLNNDGYAEKILGTCKEIGQTDEMYINIGVDGEGYLKDGYVTVESVNFKYSLSKFADVVLKNNYMNTDIRRIDFNTINPGTQSLIDGHISSVINNENGYSNISSITLHGIYVKDEVETVINKTIQLTVDWYGEAKANINTGLKTYRISTIDMYSQIYPMTQVSFDFTVEELKKQLIIDFSDIEINIPDMNGFLPTSVTCSSDDYDYIKDENKIKIHNINALTKENYSINVVYPTEALVSWYNEHDEGSLLRTYIFSADISAIFTCKNNPNSEFSNPFVSNKAIGSSTVVFYLDENSYGDDRDRDNYTFSISADGYNITYPVKGKAISKANILDQYQSQEILDNIRYTIRWGCIRPVPIDTGDEPTTLIWQEKEHSGVLGDTFDDEPMGDYITNLGISFMNNQMLGEDGKIFIYDNETDELIKTFTYDEFSTDTLFMFDVPIKHIRVETTEASQVEGASIEIACLKEIDIQSVCQDFSFEQMSDAKVLTSYLIASGSNLTNSPDGTIELYLAQEKSKMGISLLNYNMSSNEVLRDQLIKVSTINDDKLVTANWKDATFLVEFPDDIAFVDVKNVMVSNSNVNVLGYDVYKEARKIFY